MNFKYFNDEVYFSCDEIVRLRCNDLNFLQKRLQDRKLKQIRLCTHMDIEDKIHEMFIVHKKNIYVHPHKHLNKIESFHIIEGKADIVLFDDLGNIVNVIKMGEYLSGNIFYYRLSNPIFHSLIIRSEVVIFHEITNGPLKSEDTIFASWAPDKNDTKNVKKFMNNLYLSVENF